MALLVSAEAFGARVNLDLDPNGQDDRLPNVTLALTQAQDAVIDYLKIADEDMVWTDSTVPPRVSSAIMLVAQALLDDSKSAEMFLEIFFCTFLFLGSTFPLSDEIFQYILSFIL